jgi:hypothetical protein
VLLPMLIGKSTVLMPHRRAVCVER